MRGLGEGQLCTPLLPWCEFSYRSYSGGCLPPPHHLRKIWELEFTNDAMKSLDTRHPNTSIHSYWLPLNTVTLYWEFGSRDFFQGLWGYTPGTWKPRHCAAGGTTILKHSKCFTSRPRWLALSWCEKPGCQMSMESSSPTINTLILTRFSKHISISTLS